ncbi:MAG: hypothetical protein AAF604_21350 [Acidobacteriota bacterium]
MRKILLLAAMVAVLALPFTVAGGKQTADDYTNEIQKLRASEWDLFEDAWMVDDGRTVTVLWDFAGANPLAPAIEVPRKGDYWWYEGSWADLEGPARLVEDGVLLTDTTFEGETTGSDIDITQQDPDVIGILNVTDTNPPEDEKQKLVQLTYRWKRQGGGTAPPGPTVTITPNNANIIAINTRVAGGWEYVTYKMTFGPPCPASVKASFSRAPGGPAVVVGGASMIGVCANPIDGTGN